MSNSHLPQPVTRPEPADIPVRGQDTRPVEGPGCHGLAGAPRPRGSAHGGGPGGAGAGGRAKVSTEGGGQHSCARDRVGQRVCPGQQQFQSLGQGSEPHSCWFDSKGHSRGPGRQGLCHAFHKRECRAEPALPSPGLAVTCALETSWRGWRGGLEGQEWPHRAGDGLETLPIAEKQEGAIRCPKPRSVC